MAAIHAERIAELKSYAVEPIQIEDHIVEATRKLIRSNYVQLLECEAGCRVGRSAEALQKMRTATYHLWALLNLLHDNLSVKDIRRFHKQLRKLSVHLDGVYDLDMMMYDLLLYGEAVDNRMTVAGIVAYLDAQRLVARDKLIDYLDSKKYARLLNRLYDLVNQPLEELLPIGELDTHPHQVRHVLPVIIHQQLAEIRAIERAIKGNDTELYINLRRRVRLFWYTLSCFEPVLGASATQYLDSVHDLLEKLNRIYELSHTLRRLLHLPRVTLDSLQIKALKNYRRSLRDRREKLQSEFPAEWDEFNKRRVQEKLAQALLVLR